MWLTKVADRFRQWALDLAIQEVCVVEHGDEGGELVYRTVLL